MKWSACSVAVLLVATAIFTTIPGSAEATPQTQLVASGLNRPIYVTAPEGDDRLFIVEQRGIIKILSGGSVLATPFLNIDALVASVSSWGEQGLLGLAFHPDYSTNGHFFVHYNNNAGTTVIARYTVSANPDSADPASAETVMTVAQPYSNHNGGSILFGPDGYLYIGLGDGGSGGDPGNRAQNKAVLLGKILRIDVDTLPYTNPPTNPFFGVSGEDEIWAYGVRNPYRISFDRLTGDMWIGDVGQNAWEEIDFQDASSVGGENYGWRLMEGDHCYNPSTNCDDGSLVHPIHEYSHSFGCSVTGGYVYRGGAVSELYGKYLFGDWCTGSIWALEKVGASVTVTNLTSALNPGGQVNGLGSFGEDGHGEMYIVDRHTNTTGGEIYKILPDPVGVEGGASLPRSLTVGPATPNPMKSLTSFRIDVGQPGDVSVRVFDVSGRLVRTITDSHRAAGGHTIEWDGRSDAGVRLPSGIYLMKTEYDGSAAVRRVSLVR